MIKMKQKYCRRLLPVLLMLLLCVNCALADSVYMDGVVESTETRTVLANIGGTVKSIQVKAGDRVGADDVLISMQTTVVYADEPGTVYFFGNPGERTEAVEEIYGAVAVIDPDERYTVSASTTDAYNENENKLIQPGSIVYLQRGEGSNSERGIGRIYDLDGKKYKVRVLSGDFKLEDSVNIYRNNNYFYKDRLGRGDIERSDMITYSGSGSIVSLLTTNGAHVEKGQPLFETLDGTYPGLVSTGSTICAGVDGVISEIAVSHGDTIQNDQMVAEIWPDSAMRILADLSELDLSLVHVGDTVSLTFDAFPDTMMSGKIEKISTKAKENSDGKNAEFEVTISFAATEQIRYGMHVDVQLEK